MTAATIEFTGCFQKECERELFKASWLISLRLFIV
jgi:hypothetical protein